MKRISFIMVITIFIIFSWLAVEKRETLNRAAGGEILHPEGGWLAEHAWKHGFVLRYPENKIDVTGVKYEPWHYRYVGLPHSALLQEQDWVLEEYLELRMGVCRPSSSHCS